MTIKELIKRFQQPTALKIRPTGKTGEYKIEGLPALSKPKAPNAELAPRGKRKT